MDKDKGNKKKPLKLSSSGRLQIRKNLGPADDKARSSGIRKLFKLYSKIKITNRKVPLQLNQILEVHLA